MAPSWALDQRMNIHGVDLRVGMTTPARFSSDTYEAFYTFVSNNKNHEKLQVCNIIKKTVS